MTDKQKERIRMYLIHLSDRPKDKDEDITRTLNITNSELIAYRERIKQGEIDDIIFLAKMTQLELKTILEITTKD